MNPHQVAVLDRRSSGAAGPHGDRRTKRRRARAAREQAAHNDQEK